VILSLVLVRLLILSKLRKVQIANLETRTVPTDSVQIQMLTANQVIPAVLMDSTQRVLKLVSQEIRIVHQQINMMVRIQVIASQAIRIALIDLIQQLKPSKVVAEVQVVNKDFVKSQSQRRIIRKWPPNR
jgi:hypothetical protein